MRIAIIGGGISGLAAAHRLQELAQEEKRPIEVSLFEAGERLGGVIATERRDGFILESGPDSFITDKPWALQLCRRIGLEGRLIGTNAAYRRSYVVREGQLHPVPEGFQLLAPSRLGPFLASRLFSWPGKLRMVVEPFIPRRRESGDESLGEFVVRRLGREALTRIAQPMVAGIYGADPYQLSLEATLPRFKKMEQEHGSLLRAMWAAGGRGRGSEGAREREGSLPRFGAEGDSGGVEGAKGTSGARYGLFVSFDEGMQVLVDALAARLSPGTVRFGTRVKGVARDGEGWRLRVSGGEVRCDAVCLALPAHRGAELLAAVDAALADLLRAIPYASAATVNLAYAREHVPHPLDGFGFVVPSTEGRTLLGCTFSSVKFAHRAPEGFALLRAFLGGPETPPEEADPLRTGKAPPYPWHDMTDEGVIACVRQDLGVLLGITATPEFATVHRHPAAMAQYAVGHRARVAAIEERLGALAGLTLAGNGFDGIGIPDCVHGGEQAAEALWRAGVTAAAS